MSPRAVLPLLLLALLLPHPALADPLRFERLLCELAESPIGVDRAAPALSWVVSSSARGQGQSAYRIRVAGTEAELRSGAGGLWDSGKVRSAETLHHAYEGKPLRSDATYFWTVTIWDAEGREAASPIASFRTALLRPEDWKAKWIGAGPEREPRHPSGFFKSVTQVAEIGAEPVAHDGRSLLLRRAIDLGREVRSATAFVAGLGLYELSINGRRVGDRVLAPAKTNYRKQVLYDTYDVTALLRQGRNALGIHLGNGWFNPYPRWWQDYRMQWFGAKRAILQLDVVYADGGTEVFGTDESWRSAPGPVLASCIYDGESYDATEERSGWAEPSFDDAAWAAARAVEAPGGKLVSHVMPPIRVVERRSPRAVTQPRPGVRVYDLGQNFAGWVRVPVTGRRGTKLRLRFGEDIQADGLLDPTSNEGATATATYILKGGDPEVYEPRFTYFGFRYVEATAEGEAPEIGAVEGCVVHSANRPTGELRCGNDLVERIHRAAVWSQRSNMMGYPTDCPQRDERLGWLGDVQVTADEAMLNFDVALFFAHWLSTIRENQDAASGDIPIISPRPYLKDDGVEWSSTFILLAWGHYVHYGDARVLAESYEAMKRYVRYLDGIARDGIVPMGWIGDWGSLVKGWKEGEPESVPTAFYYLDAVTLAKIASVLGRPADAHAFTALAAKVRAAYNRKYFHPATSNYNDGSQMANGFPLYLGLVEEEHRAAVLENVVKDIAANGTHLTTGVLGTRYMIEALSQHGRSDVAWRLATQTTSPCWADMVARYTTLCEFWTLKQSKNHVMMGSIDAWFYGTLAGIRLDESKPAYREFTIRPYIPEGLTRTAARIDTLRGTISSSWERTGGRHVTLEVVIPFNTAATVHVPASMSDTVTETGGGAAVPAAEVVRFLRYEDGYAVFRVPSGRYRFETSRK